MKECTQESDHSNANSVRKPSHQVATDESTIDGILKLNCINVLFLDVTRVTIVMSSYYNIAKRFISLSYDPRVWAAVVSRSILTSTSMTKAYNTCQYRYSRRYSPFFKFTNVEELIRPLDLWKTWNSRSHFSRD